MPDPSRRPQAGIPPDQTSDGGTPRWVKVFGAVAVIVILVAAIALLSGGNHGPGRHTSSGGASGQTQAGDREVSGAANGHQPPPGAHDP